MRIVLLLFLSLAASCNPSGKSSSRAPGGPACSDGKTLLNDVCETITAATIEPVAPNLGICDGSVNAVATYECQTSSGATVSSDLCSLDSLDLTRPPFLSPAGTVEVDGGTVTCSAGQTQSEGAFCPTGYVFSNASGSAACELEIKSIAVTDKLICAFYSDNNVSCAGVLGNIDTTGAVSNIAEFAGVKQMVGRAGSVCVVDSNDQVKCIGTNTYPRGNFGTGGTGNLVALSPAITGWNQSQFGDPAGVVKMAMNNSSACTVNLLGEVYCSGSDTTNKLMGGAGNSSSPIFATGFNNFGMITDIKSAFANICLKEFSGQWYCGGSNLLGQLGGAPAGDPIAIGDTGTKDIAVGDNAICYIDQLNQAQCRGYNLSKKFLDSTDTNGFMFASTGVSGVVAYTGVKDVTIGTSHSCAIKLDGTVVCKGGNAFGQLGNGLVEGVDHGTEQVTLFSPARSVKSFADETCVLTLSNRVQCVGNLTGKFTDGGAVVMPDTHDGKWSRSIAPQTLPL